jgi:hypothetical protein
VRSFFVGWAARLGRLLATRGLGAEDGDAPVVQHRLPCVEIGAPVALLAVTIGAPVPLLAVTIGAPVPLLAVTIGAPEAC